MIIEFGGYMKYQLENQEYDVIIERKNNKNTYIRIKEDLKIYVTTNYFVTKSQIKKLLDENYNYVKKMLMHQKKEIEKQSLFFYLGNSYDIIVIPTLKKIEIQDNKIYTKDKKMLDKWVKEETIRIFDDRFVYIFNKFEENIKAPIIKIRNMKTRWGVYNRKNHTITLNSRLIEYDIEKIDYVIVHELSHIIHFDHSKNFWNLVSKYCKDYKRIRKELKE